MLKEGRKASDSMIAYSPLDTLLLVEIERERRFEGGRDSICIICGIQGGSVR